MLRISFEGGLGLTLMKCSVLQENFLPFRPPHQNALCCASLKRP
nr:MAG TPA: hypothetical protein [Caudoviricetes sp.]